MALWMGMLGGVINTSDLFYEIPKDRTDLFRFLEPTEPKLTSDISSLNSSGRNEILVREFPNQKSWAVLFVNRHDENVLEMYDLKKLIGLEKAYCYDWDESHIGKLGYRGNLSFELKPHQSKLIYISTEDKAPEKLTLGGLQR